VPAIIAAILAAGASSRMGQPKQLLKLGDTTLLHRIVAAADASICQGTIIVLGANADLIQSSLELPDDAFAAINSNWQEGIASSVSCAVSALKRARPRADGIVILTCDQPLVTTETIDALVRQWAKSGSLIVASRYADTKGIPALFDKDLFEELKTLRGDRGAKSLIRKHSNWVSLIDFPGGAFDIDTMDDYRRSCSQLLGAQQPKA
jgi:molybdenum cofactor cytidylyltransferase